MTNLNTSQRVWEYNNSEGQSRDRARCRGRINSKKKSQKNTKIIYKKLCKLLSPTSIPPKGVDRVGEYESEGQGGIKPKIDQKSENI